MKHSKHILFILLLLFTVSISYGQLSSGGIPASVQHKLSSDSYHMLSVPVPSMELLAEEDLQNDATGQPERFAKLVPVDISPDNAGSWEMLENGDRLWRLKVKMKNALALSLYFDRFRLPDGVRFFVYDDPDHQLLGAFTEMNNHESGLFASSLIIGDELTLELHFPKGSESTFDFHVSDIAYAYRNVPSYDGERGLASGFCEVNVNCSPEGDDWQDEKRGVVRIQVMVSGSAYWCTGSLVNNTRHDMTPYVLTADHCAFQLGHYATPTDLNQWVFYFNHESSDCESNAPGPVNSVTGAAKVASGGNRGFSGSDFYLMLLNDDIPPVYNPYFNGWIADGLASESGVCIHHPAGDIKKISTYTETLTSTSWQGNGVPSHWEVFWVETFNNWGVTEGGSSGSPLFDPDGRIVGTLTGGLASCYSQDAPDYYGKFSYHWSMNGTEDTLQLKPWLDPDNTGVLSLDGTTMGVDNEGIVPGVNLVLNPNPANDYVYLSLDKMEVYRLEISMFDILGKPISGFKYADSSGSVLIDISQIQSGIYFVRATVNDKNIIKRIVKR